MNVYIVYYGIDYEGEYILRVFETEKDAEEWMDRIERRGDYMGIWEETVCMSNDPHKFDEE